MRTPQWLGYLIQRPESHCVHHRMGVHYYNYADLPFWDMLFGTFRNPRQFMGECGFEGGADLRMGAIFALRRRQRAAVRSRKPGGKAHDATQVSGRRPPAGTTPSAAAGLPHPGQTPSCAKRRFAG